MIILLQPHFFDQFSMQFWVSVCLCCGDVCWLMPRISGRRWIRCAMWGVSLAIGRRNIVHDAQLRWIKGKQLWLNLGTMFRHGHYFQYVTVTSRATNHSCSAECRWFGGAWPIKNEWMLVECANKHHHMARERGCVGVFPVSGNPEEPYTTRWCLGLGKAIS